MMISCVFVTFPCGIQGQVWYLIVSIPVVCLLPYFDRQLWSFNNILLFGERFLCHNILDIRLNREIYVFYKWDKQLVLSLVCVSEAKMILSINLNLLGSLLLFYCGKRTI